MTNRGLHQNGNLDIPLFGRQRTRFLIVVIIAVLLAAVLSILVLD
jgi:hypothetical protein